LNNSKEYTRASSTEMNKNPQQTNPTSKRPKKRVYISFQENLYGEHSGWCSGEADGHPK